MSSFNIHSLALVVVTVLPATLGVPTNMGVGDIASMLNNAESAAAALPPVITPSPTVFAPETYISPTPWTGAGEYTSQAGDSCGTWGCGVMMPTGM